MYVFLYVYGFHKTFPKLSLKALCVVFNECWWQHKSSVKVYKSLSYALFNEIISLTSMFFTTLIFYFNNGVISTRVQT
jgi:hypothetical protein